MRIGQWIIFRDKYRATEIQEKEIEAAFRVSEETPWYRAIMSLLDSAEKRQLEDSRGFANTGNPNGALACAGALMSLDIIRTKIMATRASAVEGKE